LLDEYGREFGRQFEGDVADLLSKANDALKSGDADEAERHLNEAIVLRYAPNREDARKLLEVLREARSEAKMKSFVAAMSDAEYAAFEADLTLPDRPAFERPEIDAVFKTTLRRNHDRSRQWRKESRKGPAVQAPNKGFGFGLDELRKRDRRLAAQAPMKKQTLNEDVSYSWEWGKTRSLTVLGSEQELNYASIIATSRDDNDDSFASALVHIHDAVLWVTGERVTGDRLTNWIKSQGELKVGSFVATVSTIRATDGLVFMVGIKAQ
jgi:hypothetical protein